jgi:beta-xylosidase
MRLLTLLLTACACCWAQAARVYTNPVGETPIRMGDPFVLRHGRTYYLLGTTSTQEGFQYFTSMDLVHWKPGGWAWRKTADSWAEDLFWAPELIHYRGRFYMTYSGRVRGARTWHMLTALAVSDKPEGPYRDLYAPWFDAGYSAIDAHIFVDSGKPYLYFSRNGSRDGYSYGAIYGVALSRDLSHLLGDPIKLLEAGQPWERIDWESNRCNEGPAVLKHKGRYYMTYSANNTGAAGYGVGYAVADRPLGPWRKSADNPVLASRLDIGVSSPGHNSITTSPDGRERFIVYHSHADPRNTRGARVVNIDRLVIDRSGALRVLGPTRSPQPMPSGVR